MANQERTVTFGNVSGNSSNFGTDDDTKQTEQWIEPSDGIPQGNRLRRVIVTPDQTTPNQLKIHLVRGGKIVNTMDAVLLRASLVGPDWPPMPMNIGTGRIQWIAENKTGSTINSVTMLQTWVNPLQRVVVN